MTKIAIFASGSGSNAENIHQYFANNSEIEVSLVVTNNKNAFVLERAKRLEIETLVVVKSELHKMPKKLIDKLKREKIDWIILAGFLLLIPESLIKAYPRKIINIHPALLPKFGGKGMYGDFVHHAVYEAGEKQSGITIHYVNEQYDEGNIIFQEKTPLHKSDTPDIIKQKVQALEYENYPKVIEKIIKLSA